MQLRPSRASLRNGWSSYEKEKRLVELQRIQQRTMYDLEMIKEVGTAKESKIIRAISASGILENLPHAFWIIFRRISC